MSKEVLKDKRAKRIVVVNQKGGSAKTTTARMLVDYAVRQGKKVLAIDLDPQATFTTWMGISQQSLVGNPNEASNIFSKEQPQSIWHTEFGCDIVPVSYTEMLEKTERTISGKELMLNKFLTKVENDYDLIIVDTAGFMGAITKSAIIACPTLVVPTQTAVVDADGTQRFYREVSECIEIFNCNIKELFVVPTIHDKRQSADNMILADIQTSTPVMLGTLYGFSGVRAMVTDAVPRNSSIKEAMLLGDVGVSPQDSLRDKYKSDVASIIDSICHNIIGD